MQKIICLDYDGTYTDFSELFDLFIDKAKELGHKVILCTMRSEAEKDNSLVMLESKLDKVYYSNRRAKQSYLASLGVYPDIWIDDQPHFLFESAR